MDPFLLAVAIAGGGAIALFAVAFHQRVTVDQRIMVRRIQPIKGGLGFSARTILRDRSGHLGFLGWLPFSSDSTQQTALDLERAGWTLRVNEYLGLRLACALAGAVVGLLAVPGGLTQPLAMAGLALAGWLGPRFSLTFARRHQVAEIDKQLPGALTAMAKSLRAGSGLLQALGYAASETPAPLGPELKGVLRDLQLGADPDEVFADLSRRVGSDDLDIAITAIVIQRTFGGNLSEILTHVTDTVRQRAELLGEIRVLTSQQRMSAYMAAALPVGVAALVMMMRPELGNLLLNTTIGHIAMGVAAVFELAGIWMIHEMGAIEV